MILYLSCFAVVFLPVLTVYTFMLQIASVFHKKWKDFLFNAFFIQRIDMPYTQYLGGPIYNKSQWCFDAALSLFLIAVPAIVITIAQSLDFGMLYDQLGIDQNTPVVIGVFLCLVASELRIQFRKPNIPKIITCLLIRNYVTLGICYWSVYYLNTHEVLLDQVVSITIPYSIHIGTVLIALLAIVLDCFLLRKHLFLNFEEYIAKIKKEQLKEVLHCVFVQRTSRNIEKSFLKDLLDYNQTTLEDELVKRFGTIRAGHSFEGVAVVKGYLFASDLVNEVQQLQLEMDMLVSASANNELEY